MAESAPASPGGTPTPSSAARVPRRVVSGMRPTGRMHLGHYHGALRNWISIAEKVDCFYFSADWHALTTHYQDPSGVRQAERDMFADWIAAGLDPRKNPRVAFFRQSDVKQHAELFLLLGMISPIGWLERVPTYKEQQEQLKDRDLSTYGFLGYPVLQTADVAVYGADAVPVGQDQVSHLELSRELVRRFNFFYGKRVPGAPGEEQRIEPVLVEPQPLLTPVPKILGTDGRKMSKSYGNAIDLGEEPEIARKKIMAAMTDPARKRRHDPGHPEVCGIYYLHRAYSSPARIQEVEVGCRSAGIGCVDCKKMLLESLLPSLEAHRAARAELDRDPALIEQIVQLGTEKARAAAESTMQGVRAAMKLA